jgi:hypothetical protein
MRRMRSLLPPPVLARVLAPPPFALLLFAPLLFFGGCASAGPTAGALAVVDVAAIPILHRDILDTLYSAVSGRDCSVVRLDQGQSYCRETEPPPVRPAFCTRSLAAVDCWANPEALPGHPREVADGPRVLTPAQEANRTRRWPDF